MSLRVAVQMDPLENINISGDSTFALMLKAQERGHRLYHYLAEDLTWQDGRLYAGARDASVQSVSGEGLVKATIVPPGEATANLIEKLAFRRHRRQVAGVRQPRRG